MLLLILLSTPAISAQFLTIADVHYGENLPSGEGQDTGDILWSSTLMQFQSQASRVDFIILLGDLPAHGVSGTEKNLYETTVFKTLLDANTTKKPIFFVSGNNDSLVGNYQAFSKDGVSPLDNAQGWEEHACAYCSNLLIDTSAMFSGGYYSTYVQPDSKDIALIVLNATPLTYRPKWAGPYPEQADDAEAELKWLAKQLNQLETKQLLIAMHQEPGLDFSNKPIWQKSYLKRFIKLLSKAQSKNPNISLLAAHSHYDELRKIPLLNHSSIYVYSTPSISRSHYNNPAMKVFDISQTGEVQNFTTFYTQDDTQWKDEHYQALHSNNRIFSSCNQSTLPACLNSLTVSEVCHVMEEKQIYGVKNSRVVDTNCINTYTITANDATP